MDFAWSEQQRELLSAVDRFASEQLNYDVIANDRDAVFNHEAWKKCGAFGIQGLPVAEEYGGLAQDPLTTVAALERLGYGCKDNGLLFSINAHMWTAIIPLLYNGTEAQKKKFLPGLCNGSLIGGNAMSEPNSGSDAFSLATTAVKKGAKYILNGSKIFVTNGPIADVILVFAMTDKAKGASGISAFLVEKRRAGARCFAQDPEDGRAHVANGGGVFHRLRGAGGKPARQGRRGQLALHPVDDLGTRLHPGERGRDDAAVARDLYSLCK